MKLNREIRNSIIKKAIAFRFRHQEQDIETARRALGPLLYRHIVSEDEERRIRALPDWQQWCRTTICIVVECEGYCSSYFINNYLHQHRHELPAELPLDDPRPWRITARDETKVTRDHPLYHHFHSLSQEYVRLQTAKESLGDQLRELLNSCNTLRQLREAWPEGEQFFPAEVPKTTAVVPVGLAAGLTKALGLKPSKASAATQAIQKAASKE